MSTENYLARKGIEFYIMNTTPICNGDLNPASTKIFMNMTSANINLHEEFTVP